MITINIAREYTMTPGGRYVKEGKYSGEDFRESLLMPRYLDAKKNNDHLEICFDGGYGYPTSFLEEAFGGLTRRLDGENILERISIISNDQPDLVNKITKYVKDASANR